ncbi:helix-turn-helix domain-containing protein [Maribacter sp. MAR_2009_72]|uniref:helix-turn-helix domain-containing protein n=1 Tax=Maribacter sp. MAR_2009_72 TaxID=1250050 RepID=UPI001199C007|nr:helix-turn-helix domain-containing protein [Maribacter sp. MAR_2009_72]TVZ13965.1 excisionase family DNA binding protein [Maribacter sp. MAR_2009_72]
MDNPFETLHSDITELKLMVAKLLSQPEEDNSEKMYSLKQASDLLGVDRQTVRNHIDRGNIKANRLGRRIFIEHKELYDSMNEIKSIKYKR